MTEPVILAVGLGEIRFSDNPQLVQFKRAYQPRPQTRALYEEKFVVFQQIYKPMKKCVPPIEQIMEQVPFFFHLH